MTQSVNSYSPIERSHSYSQSFDVDLACQYSLEEAVVIQHFQYWISKNQTAERNFIQERTWTAQKLEDIAFHLPFFSIDQVRGILKKLLLKEVLVKQNFNKDGLNRTLSYAFKNEKMFVTKRLNRVDLVDSPDDLVKIPNHLPNAYGENPKSIDYQPLEEKINQDSVKIDTTYEQSPNLEQNDSPLTSPFLAYPILSYNPLLKKELELKEKKEEENRSRSIKEESQIQSPLAPSKGSPLAHPQGSASPPPLSNLFLKDRNEIKEERTQRAPAVYLTNMQHEILMERVGQDESKLKRVYERLSLWKIGSQRGREYDDYQAINRWVIKVLEEEDRRNPPPLDVNAIVQEINSHIPESMSKYFFTGYDYVERGGGQFHEHVKIGEKGWKEKVENMFRKCNLDISWMRLENSFKRS